MKIKVIAPFILFSLLSACTSQPLVVNYYLLHTPAADAKTATTQPHPDRLVVLEKAQVADYLRQSNLVMQVGQNELYFSKQDIWAQDLQSAFQEALVQDLNQSLERNYVLDNSPFASSATTNLEIKLEHFHATDASTVVTSGKYWLNSHNGQLAEHHFYFELALEQDGYAHSVKKLRQLVELIATQIQKDVMALPIK